MQVISLAVLGLLGLASAAPRELKPRASCNHDNLLRSFLDTRYSASASVYCSSYIGQVQFVEVTATSTFTPEPIAKRATPTLTPCAFSSVTTYPASRLSSACSCLITAGPVTATSTVTVATTTVTGPPRVPTYCNLQGSLLNNFLATLPGVPANSPAACQAACQATAGCNAFQYTPSTGLCAAYSDIVNNDFFVGDTSAVTYDYDVVCSV